MQAPVKVAERTSLDKSIPPGSMPPIEDLELTELFCVRSRATGAGVTAVSSKLPDPPSGMGPFPFTVLPDTASAVTEEVPGVRFRCGMVPPRDRLTSGRLRYDRSESGTNENI